MNCIIRFKECPTELLKKYERQFTIIFFIESPGPSRFHLFLSMNNIMSHFLPYDMNLKAHTTVTCVLFDFKRGLRDIFLKAMLFQSLLHMCIVVLFPLRHIDYLFVWWKLYILTRIVQLRSI